MRKGNRVEILILVIALALGSSGSAFGSTESKTISLTVAEAPCVDTSLTFGVSDPIGQEDTYPGNTFYSGVMVPMVVSGFSCLTDSSILASAFNIQTEGWRYRSSLFGLPISRLANINGGITCDAIPSDLTFSSSFLNLQGRLGATSCSAATTEIRATFPVPSDAPIGRFYSQRINISVVI